MYYRPRFGGRFSSRSRSRRPVGWRRWFPRLTFATLLLLSTGVRAALPAGWTAADLGSPVIAGSAGYAGGVWTISGGGAGICNNDQMHFAWTPVNGDGVMVAKVETVQGGGAAQAGVMLRNDVTGGSIEAAVLTSPASGVTFQWRTAVGPSCYYQVVVGVENLSAPLWVRMVRSGNQVSGYWSTNSLDWYQVGSTQTVPLSQSMLAGLAVGAGDNAALASATFSQVSTPEPVFGLFRELWTDLNSSLGATLTALTNTAYNPNWPDNPNPAFTKVAVAFETDSNTGLSWYGQRLRGFVVPPQDGDYTFWISSDDTSELLLGAGEASSPNLAHRLCCDGHKSARMDARTEPALRADGA